MASATPLASGSSTPNDTNPGVSSSTAGEGGTQDSTFECNICLDTAKDAVISLCGHLFWYDGVNAGCQPLFCIVCV